MSEALSKGNYPVYRIMKKQVGTKGLLVRIWRRPSLWLTQICQKYWWIRVSLKIEISKCSRITMGLLEVVNISKYKTMTKTTTINKNTNSITVLRVIEIGLNLIPHISKTKNPFRLKCNNSRSTIDTFNKSSNFPQFLKI
jgi:hypothetical protein